MSERYYSGKTITDILQQEVGDYDLLSRILSRLKYAEDDCADGDMISRQAAIEEISKQQTYKMFAGEDTVYFDANDIGSVLASLPSVQPEPDKNTRPERPETDRFGAKTGETQQTSKADPSFTQDCISRQAAIEVASGYCHPANIAKELAKLPSVSPARPTGWIPVKFRPLTDEEQEEYPDYCYMAECQMPDDEEEILVTVKSSKGNLYVEKDVCYFDDGFSLDSGYDWQTDVIAWMPLPEPYAERREDADR